MKQNDVIEGNKLIAEFMGWRRGKSIAWAESEGEGYYRTEDNTDFVPDHWLCFHESWNELMPIIEKIRNFKDGEYHKDGFTFGGMSVHISDAYPKGWRCHILGILTVLHVDKEGMHRYSELPNYSEVIDQDDDFKLKMIEIVWQSCLKFISWYNSQPVNK